MKQTIISMALGTAGLLCGSLGLTGCKQETIERTGTEQRIDEQLTKHIKTAFENSPAFKFPDVQVTPFKGKIQLSGFVQSDDQKRAAEAIAKGIPGVVEVENKIALKY